jgi:sugar O-acyltransferase (sialic acid O-acetyltransferase NeuD family)
VQLPVVVPKVSENDEQIKLVRWLVDDGDSIENGQAIATLESGKAVFDLVAGATGILSRQTKTGDICEVGDSIASIEAAEVSEISSADSLENRSELTVTSPIPFVGDDSAKRVAIIGAGDGAVQMIDILHRSGAGRCVGLYDDNSARFGRSVAGVEIVGNIQALLSNKDACDCAFVAIGTNLLRRQEVFEQLQSAGIDLTNIIDPSVQIASDVKIGDGNFIGASTRIGPSAQIGNNCSINSFVSIEHHNLIGNHVSIAPGVVFSGRVEVRDRVKFGTGVFVEPHIVIGEDSVIASGSIITSNVPANSIVKSPRLPVIRPRN